MMHSQLEARIYGVGELITQRKLFAVPSHQRSYAWGDEQVERFLVDIRNATLSEDTDYFVGLLVMQARLDGIWEILDGQQRLATTTMVYSAIRNWLMENRLELDANQIEGEFIGVRQLGGKFSPRLQMNLDNRTIFERYVVSKVSRDELRDGLRGLRKGSSNARLLEAALMCRDWIDEIAEEKNEKEIQPKADSLFSLARFMENSVKVVCVSVASDGDAFTLFEVLNDRGADLSALDLVKNHIFGQTHEHDRSLIENQWQMLIAAFDDRIADDFLKVFWTSRYGVVQKNDVYQKIKEAFPSAANVRELVTDFLDAAKKLRAVDDPSDPLWADYPPEAQDYLAQINLIGSRLVRPVILSALSRFSPRDLPSLLWMLVVILVRYQVIGRGRTGILEKNLGRMCERIWDGGIRSTRDAWNSIEAIVPPDAQFSESFAKHIEGKSLRIRYLLAAINKTLMEHHKRSPEGVQVNDLLSNDRVIAQISPIGGDLLPPRTILDYFLIERDKAEDLKSTREEIRAEVLATSILPLTRRLGENLLHIENLPRHERSLGNYAGFVCARAAATWSMAF